MTGRHSIQQFDRVLKHYVSEEAFKSMADADPFDQQEYREWFDQTHEEEYYND